MDRDLAGGPLMYDIALHLLAAIGVVWFVSSALVVAAIAACVIFDRAATRVRSRRFERNLRRAGLHVGDPK